MKKNNLTYYIQKINQVVEETEKTGETMHPSFEIIRSAIDEDKAGELTPEQIIEIRGSFADGVLKYQELVEVIKSLKAPARVIGIHKKLERSYGLYVEGCQAMVESLSEDGSGVAIDDFNDAEQKQDEVTDKIAFCIQRMTSILLK